MLLLKGLFLSIARMSEPALIDYLIQRIKSLFRNITSFNIDYFKK